MSGHSGAVALVTGASSGIGRAIALALGASGTSLALVGRRPDALREVAEQAAAPAETYVLDLADDSALADLARRVEADLGGLDVLVHSAGAVALGPVSSAPVEDLDTQYRVNVRAPYLLTQLCLPLLRAARGQIVFVNSSAGVARARGGVGQYAATKHALRALADSVREEVNPDGIRVLSVFPGRTATPMQALVHKLEGREYRPGKLMRPEDVAAAVASAVALPRSAEVTEVDLRPAVNWAGDGRDDQPE
jgi:NAD(P)-dependent dehydrogenase (short-subunit alcohol dehydrogenase family)